MIRLILILLMPTTITTRLIRILLIPILTLTELTGIRTQITLTEILLIRIIPTQLTQM
jgi:hypothetical protein